MLHKIKNFKTSAILAIVQFLANLLVIVQILLNFFK